MSSDTDGLPQAAPSSIAADASHSLQILPEKLAEHTIELGRDGAVRGSHGAQ